MPNFVADRRIYVDQNGKVVKEGSPEAFRLLVAEGGTLPMPVAEIYGLGKSDGSEGMTEREKREADAAILAAGGPAADAVDLRRRTPAERAAILAQAADPEELEEALRMIRERNKLRGSESRARFGPDDTRAREAPIGATATNRVGLSPAPIDMAPHVVESDEDEEDDSKSAKSASKTAKSAAKRS